MVSLVRNTTVLEFLPAIPPHFMSDDQRNRFLFIHRKMEQNLRSKFYLNGGKRHTFEIG